MRKADSKTISLSSLINVCVALLVAGATTTAQAASLTRTAPNALWSLRALALESFAPQQSNLGRRVRGGNKSTGSSTGTTAPTGTKTTPSQTGGGGNSRGTGAGRGSNNSTRYVAPTLPVVFQTDAPGTQVFLSGRLIGVSGNDARVSVNLRRGTYTVATKQQNGNVSIAQAISVAPGNTTFKLSSNGAVSISAPANGGGNPSASAEEILRRYSDPKQSDSVTESDWQRVLSLSNAGLAQDQANARLKAQTLFAQGQLAFIHGDFAAARTAFNSAALALPDSPLAFYGLGNAYLATNQPVEAFRAYQRVLELDKDFALAYKGMGDALTKQKKNKEALDSYARARELGYSSTDTGYNTALNLMKRGQWNAALKELNELAKTRPSAEVYLGIGDSYMGLKKPLSAAQAYRRATELDAKSALAAFKYGELMYNQREYAEATEALERALTLDQTGDIIKRKRAREMADEAAKRLSKMN